MIIEHMTERLTTAARRVDIRLNVGIRITLYFYTIHMLNIVTIQFWYRNEIGISLYGWVYINTSMVNNVIEVSFNQHLNI